jgi:hypothetical protein
MIAFGNIDNKPNRNVSQVEAIVDLIKDLDLDDNKKDTMATIVSLIASNLIVKAIVTLKGYCYLSDEDFISAYDEIYTSSDIAAIIQVITDKKCSIEFEITGKENDSVADTTTAIRYATPLISNMVIGLDLDDEKRCKLYDDMNIAISMAIGSYIETFINMTQNAFTEKITKMCMDSYNKVRNSMISREEPSPDIMPRCVADIMTIKRGDLDE